MNSTRNKVYYLRLFKLTKQASGILNAPSFAEAVESQLVLRQPADNVVVGRVCQVSFDELSPLGVTQQPEVVLAPLEDHLGQTAHEDSVECVCVRCAAPGETAHEVPDVESDLQHRPGMKHATV